MGSKLYIIDDETGERLLWANPLDPDEVSWRCVYAEPSRSDLLSAAYFRQCYTELIFMPQKLRNRRIAQIKAEALSLQHQLDPVMEARG